jgi:hypothetical protein
MVGHPQRYFIFLGGSKTCHPTSLYPPFATYFVESEQLALGLYDGISDPREHVAHCIQVWEVVKFPSQLWVHQFIHSLGKIPVAWYIHEEARCQTICWEILQ